jgi:aspartate/tyrosine/aromatic aminotransferase
MSHRTEWRYEHSSNVSSPKNSGVTVYFFPYIKHQKINSIAGRWMSMDLHFGNKVVQLSKQLVESGKDSNQIAKILFEKDNQGHNYGIGIILDGTGKPMKSSEVLLEYTKQELENSIHGDYANSAKIMDAVKAAVLTWQRIPEKYWANFVFALPSDAGTGAVKTAVEVLLSLHPELTAIAVQELGWPAYKAIAKTARVSFSEFPIDAVIDEEKLLPVYQAGPMNTTGKVPQEETVIARAKAAAAKNRAVVLDRAYSGFEFASAITKNSYDQIMKKSYELQIEPFIAEGVPFALTISPTKAFVTFSLRPCGFLLVYCPESREIKQTTAAVNATMRARGSSFEHPVTRAFAKALVNDLLKLEEEHIHALKRLAEAEKVWSALARQTSIEKLFSPRYAGLFRNPKARPDAASVIYNKHIYPVFAQDRCRLNVTGIPSDNELAKEHVRVFAGQCYED